MLFVPLQKGADGPTQSERTARFDGYEVSTRLGGHLACLD